MKICISITETDLKKVKEILKQFDFCELRLDLIKPPLGELKEFISINKNVIVTCRQNNELDRILYLREAIKLKPRYVDIEFETEESAKIELISLCQQNNVKRIHSYHNFEKTPDFLFLKSIIEKERLDFNPSIIKIATYVNNEKDNLTLLSLLNLDISLVVLGMGDSGKKTRLFAPLFGSEFTFASIGGKASAPGQIDYFKIKEFYDFFRELF